MKSQKVRILCLFAAFFVISLIISDLFISKYSLCITEYSLESNKMSQPVRIVQLTDLHNSEFGKNNSTLVKSVSECDPDLILITGDSLVDSDDNTSIATNLIENLSQIADVYVSVGNHEIDFAKHTGLDIMSLYTAAGAIVLDEAYTDIEVNGQELRIGGVYGYCLPQRYEKEQGFRQEQADFLSDFQNTNRYKVLMSHLPFAWWNYGFGNEWNVDLVLCGHTHGGQIIIPFVGGLYDAETGWFPGGVSGYKHDGADIIVSRGLGNTESIPRFNNIPEIVEIDIE